MDRQSRIQGDGFTFQSLSGDVPFCRENMADLFAADLQITAAVEAARNVDL